MRKLILATAAAFALTGGFANAQGIIRDHDANDKSQWINLWAGQSEDEVYDRRYGGSGSSASTFSGRGSTQFGLRGGGMLIGTDGNEGKRLFFENEHRHTGDNAPAYSRLSGSRSTQSGRSGNSTTLGTGENARKYFFVESENRS